MSTPRVSLAPLPRQPGGPTPDPFAGIPVTAAAPSDPFEGLDVVPAGGRGAPSVPAANAPGLTPGQRVAMILRGASPAAKAQEAKIARINPQAQPPAQPDTGERWSDALGARGAQGVVLDAAQGWGRSGLEHVLDAAALVSPWGRSRLRTEAQRYGAPLPGKAELAGRIGENLTELGAASKPLQALDRAALTAPRVGAALESMGPVARALSRAGIIAGTQGGVGALWSAAEGGSPAAGGLGGAVVGGAGEMLGPAAQWAAPLLQRSAEKQYGRFLYPTKSATKYIARKIIPEMLRRGIVTTSPEKLAERAMAQSNLAGARLEDATEAYIARENTAPQRLALPPATRDMEIPATRESQAPMVHPARAGAPFREPRTGRMARSYTSAVEAPNEPAEFELRRDTPAGPRYLSPGSPAAGSPVASYEGVLRRPEPPAMGRPMEQPAMPTAPLADALEAAKNEFRVNGVPTNPGAVAQLARLQRTVRAHGDYMSFRDLRTLRQQLDRDVAEGGGYAGKTLKEATALRAKERLANEIRGALAAKAPELTPFNQEFNFWKNVERTAAETALRQTGQQGGLLRVLGPLAVGGDIGIGAERGLGAAGAGGAAMGTAYGVARGMRSPLWRTASAVAKARVARLLAKGAARGILPGGEPARLLAGAALAPSELQGYLPPRPRQ